MIRTLQEFRARYVPLDPAARLASVAYWPVWCAWAAACGAAVVVCWARDQLR